jgi:hypothetical protein
MQKNTAFQSGIFNPRILLAFTLCSVGALLAMFSLGATPPVGTPRANSSLPTDPRNFPSTFGSNANRLPPGVPLPPGAQFSVNRQGDSSSGSQTAGFPGFGGMPLRPGTASSANPLGNPGFANQQGASLSVLQRAAPESMPLASGAAGDWSIVSSPNIATESNYLQAVTCVSASECWAVGYSFNDNFIAQTLIERWDGTSWAIVSSPNTSTMQTNLLFGVTCVSASECWAVGYYFNDNFIPQTLIERWDGTSWAIVTSPNTDPTQNNFLVGVTCVSASECWAVGDYYDVGSIIAQTQIEHWDGASWVIVPSPNTDPAQANFLVGVTCVSASECWAVGYYFSGSAYQTLIERWDGTSWAIVTSPNANTTQYNVGV